MIKARSLGMGKCIPEHHRRTKVNFGKKTHRAPSTTVGVQHSSGTPDARQNLLYTTIYLKGRCLHFSHLVSLIIIDQFEISLLFSHLDDKLIVAPLDDRIRRLNH